MRKSQATQFSLLIGLLTNLLVTMPATSQSSATPPLVNDELSREQWQKHVLETKRRIQQEIAPLRSERRSLPRAEPSLEDEARRASERAGELPPPPPLGSAIDPARFGLPTADTAGVPAGVTLTNYNGPMTITTPGAVIENVIINGQLTIAAANVTVRDCVIQTNDWYGIDSEQIPVTVQNCKIIGGPNSSSGILGNGTFIGNDISHVCIGIQLTDGASTVRGNYIHDLGPTYAPNNPEGPHYDGITALGGQDHVVIEHNTISIPPGQGGTGEVFLDNDFGSVNDITIRDNLLFGDPAYAMQLVQKTNLPGTITNVVVENNYLEKGEYGYILQQNMAPATIRNNIAWDNRIDPIPYPDDGPFAWRSCGYGLRCPLVAR